MYLKEIMLGIFKMILSFNVMYEIDVSSVG